MEQKKNFYHSMSSFNQTQVTRVTKTHLCQKKPMIPDSARVKRVKRVKNEKTAP